VPKCLGAKLSCYFVHNITPLFWHQPFHNLVRLFPGLFWGQTIDSVWQFTTLFQIYLKLIWPKRQECERKHTFLIS
jgi:hypothetical protein